MAHSFLLLAQGSMVVDVAVLLGLIAIVFLFGLLLFLRLSAQQEDGGLPPGKRPVNASAEDTLPPPMPRAATAAADRPTSPGISTRSVSLTTAPYLGVRDTTAEREALLAEAQESMDSNPERAALIYESLAYWPEAAAMHHKSGDLRRAADIYLALRQEEKALPLLREALEAGPSEENLRLRCIEACLDLGHTDEADALVSAVTAPESPLQPSASFLQTVGLDYEAIGDLPAAKRFYHLALQRHDGLSDIQFRLLYLRHLDRLQGPPETGGSSAEHVATELLQKYIRESSIIPTIDHTKDPATAFAGREIVVGHLALGFRQTEPRQSVRSVFSISRRFQFQRLLSETSRAATFEATDRLLDFPVALKLVRLSMDANGLEVLKERLRAIAQLNHPNLAKVMFVDRDGYVLRVVTEWLPGGNLREFLGKLGGVGYPLLIRMAMHLASALHTAHTRGIPHGDIRPENILIGTDNRIKLVDFALSAIPISRPGAPRPALSDAMDTPRSSDLVVHNEGVQSDLLQVGELIDFLLQNARRTVDPISPVPTSQATDPSEELRALVEGLRGGNFTSVLRVWQVLEQIFERTLPAGSGSDTSSSSPRLG